jgi:hypothetical protein
MAPSGAIFYPAANHSNGLSASTNNLTFDSTIGSTIFGVNKSTKLLAAMRNNPRDWRIEELLVIAMQCGLECRNHGGSHHVFSYPGVDGGVCVPAHRPIKPVYIRQFLSLVDSVMESKK